jgi:hypothetical protein
MKLLHGSLFSLVMSLWLLISPSTFGFADLPAAYWNAVIVGVLSAVSAAVGLYWSRDGLMGTLPHHQKV